MIRKLPLPLSGLMLGMAALGNLLASYGEGFRMACGCIAAVLCLLTLAKLLRYPSAAWEELKNPVIASVFSTFPMGLMLLSTYIKPYVGVVATGLWFGALALHIAWIVYFTCKHVVRFDIKAVHASYFVVYVGIAAAGVSAPAHGMQAIGRMAMWFGLISLGLLLPVIIYRYVRYPKVPPPLEPIFCIFAAPASLCLVAYLQSFDQKAQGLVIVLGIVAALLYTIGLVRCVMLLRKPFFPSHSSYTFPFAISAMAAKQTNAFLAAAGQSPAWLPIVITIATAIATVLVLTVLVRYGMYLAAQAKAQRGQGMAA